MPYTTQTRWSVERDGWEIRLFNPKGEEVARMSWREWQRLPANWPFNSGFDDAAWACAGRVHGVIGARHARGESLLIFA
jgi:hypothetical protein